MPFLPAFPMAHMSVSQALHFDRPVGVSTTAASSAQWLHKDARMHAGAAGAHNGAAGLQCRAGPDPRQRQAGEPGADPHAVVARCREERLLRPPRAQPHHPSSARGITSPSTFASPCHATLSWHAYPETLPDTLPGCILGSLYTFQSSQGVCNTHGRHVCLPRALASALGTPMPAACSGSFLLS